MNKTMKTVEPARTVRDPVAINPQALDQECMDHPRRVRDCGEALARAERAMSRAEAGFKIEMSRLKVAIRCDPEVYGLPAKPAMELVESVAMTETTCIDAQMAYIERVYDRDVLRAEQYGLRDRKDMLNNAVRLELADYQSVVQLDEQSRESVEERARKRVRKGIDP